MASVTFVLKEPNANQETLIYLLFRWSSQKLKYSTGQKIHPNFWNIEKHRAKASRQFPGHGEFNMLLDKLEHKIHESFRRLINDGITPTIELLKESLNDTLLKKDIFHKHDLISFSKKLIEDSTKKRETLANYKQTLRNLEEYKNQKNKSLAFESINQDFYEEFMKFCLQKNYSTNTIGGFIKNIKVFMNESFDRGLHKNLDHKKSRFKKVEEESENIYLNEKEINLLYDLDLSANPRLDRVRDLFLIACYTGLRYFDLSQLNEKNLIDKSKIKIVTEKTGELVIIPLHRIVISIFEKYDWKFTGILSNQKMNEYLKELAEKAKINKKISITSTKGGKKVTELFNKYELVTVHTARRSFATNAYLMDVPTLSIMKITGHRTEKAFLKYIKFSQEENANKLLNHPFFK